MARLFPLFITLAALLGLIFVCAQRHAGLIQTELLADVRSALADEDFATVATSVHWRDITLSGSVDSEEDRARAHELAQSVWGVHDVVSDLEVRVLPKPSFELDFERGQVVLSGVVNREAAVRNIEAGATSIYGEDGFRNQLTTNDVQASSWLANLVEVLRAHADAEGGLETTGFRIASDRMTLFGQVPSTELREQIANQIALVVPDLVIDNQIQVVGAETQIAEILDLEVIEFETDSDQLTAEGRRIALRVRAILARIGDFEIEVGGHTDSVGDSAYNRDLSRRRALTVVRTLSETLPRDQFTVRGFGEERPIADNETEAGRQKNRRIEFRFLRGGTIASAPDAGDAPPG